MTGIRTSIRMTSGSSCARKADRVGAVGGLADDHQIGLGGEQRAEALAHHRLVVGDQARDRSTVARRRRASGSTAETAKPPTALGPAEIEPPSSATRSRIPAMPWPGRAPSAGPRRTPPAGR